MARVRWSAKGAGVVSRKRRGTNSTRKDMSVFSFVLMLLLLGMFAAAHSDRPVFWLLVGPFPLAVGFTLTTFLRQGFGRQIRSKEKRETESAADN
jgi:hypothetical protein